MKNLIYILLFLLIGCTTVNCPDCPPVNQINDTCLVNYDSLMNIVQLEKLYLDTLEKELAFRESNLDSFVPETTYVEMPVFDTIHITDTQNVCIETLLSEDILREWESDLIKAAIKNEQNKKNNDSARIELLAFQSKLNERADTLNQFRDYCNWWVRNEADSLYLVYFRKDSLLSEWFNAKNALIYDFFADSIVKIGGIYKNQNKRIVIAPIWVDDTLKTF